MPINNETANTLDVVRKWSPSCSVICVCRVVTGRNTLFRSINLCESHVLDLTFIHVVLYSEHPNVSKSVAYFYKFLLNSNADPVQSRESPVTATFLATRGITELTFPSEDYRDRGFSLFRTQGPFGRDHLNFKKFLPRLVCGFLPHPRLYLSNRLWWSGRRQKQTPVWPFFRARHWRRRNGNSEWPRENELGISRRQI